jgi:ATP-binding cassette subfamily F protein uup
MRSICLSLLCACDALLALDGSGNVVELGGGYDDYARYRERTLSEKQAAAELSKSAPAKSSSAKSSSAKSAPVESGSAKSRASGKLSFKEQREFDALPERIAAIESAQAAWHAKMAEPDFFKQPPDQIKRATEELAAQEAELEALYARWEELEAR